MSLFDLGIGTLTDLALASPTRTGIIAPVLSAGVNALPAPSRDGPQVGPARDISLVKIEIHLAGK